MGDYIRKFDIPAYSAATVYDKYAVVKRANGNSEYYFVSARDSNLAQLDTSGYTSNSYWKRFDDFNNDFGSVWTPSYTTSAEVEPRVINATFDDGVTQLARDGINETPLRFNLVFENIGDSEAKSLLCFFELMGSSRSFRWTTPEPYSKLLTFSMTNLRHAFLKKNVHNVSVGIEQSFVIFGVGAGQQKFGAF
jgi:phage-related protein